MSGTHEAVSRSEVTVGWHGVAAERRADKRVRTAERRMGFGARPAAGAHTDQTAHEMLAPAPVARIAQSPSTSLPARDRVRFGGALDHDCSQVRVHTGPEARAAASSIGAHAFTLGSHIALPDTHPSVPAHELGNVRSATLTFTVE